MKRDMLQHRTSRSGGDVARGITFRDSRSNSFLPVCRFCSGGLFVSTGASVFWDAIRALALATVLLPVENLWPVGSGCSIKFRLAQQRR